MFESLFGSSLIVRMIDGSLVSLQVFFLTMLFAVPLGFLVAFGRMSNIKIVQSIFKFYILIIRGTPLMLQIVVIFYAPASFLMMLGINIDRVVAVIIAFSLNYAAYFAEIYRGGIESIPKGQYEAADVLGLTKIQTFFRIVLPQVIKRILPPMSNETITLVKDTVLVQVVGVSELFRVAQQDVNRTSQIGSLFIAGLFYLIINWGVTNFYHITEKKLSYYR